MKERSQLSVKMKNERRRLIRRLPPETAVNILLACWDYLETGEIPEELSPFESIAAGAFLSDLLETFENREDV